MFRSFLRTHTGMTHVGLRWLKKVPGLVRVVIPDETGSRAFVTVYLEQTREYIVMAFRLSDGEELWRTPLPNGGYGAPALAERALFVLNGFSDVSAIERGSGRLLWTVQTKARVRSPIALMDHCAVFSSGGTVLQVSESGEVCGQWSLPGAFFYGAIDQFEGCLVTLGTVQNREGFSCVHLFWLNRMTGQFQSLELAEGPVVSSDVAGLAVAGRYAFVGLSNEIVCVDLGVQQIVWRVSVEGFAGRHACSVDERLVYYTTMQGVVGALCKHTGAPLWNIRLNDGQTVAPVSIGPDSVYILGDGCLNICRKDDGLIAYAIPVGHSPYSMATLQNDLCLIGGGEPPHHGLLLAIGLNEDPMGQVGLLVESAQLSGDRSALNVLVAVVGSQHVTDLVLDGAVLGHNEGLSGERVGRSSFAFRISLDITLASGDYLLPVTAKLSDGGMIDQTVVVAIPARHQLPSSASLEYSPNIRQEGLFLSGAAIAATVLGLYGGRILSQSAIRDMVDAVRDKSHYERFQTWRILLRRVLTSSASDVNQLPEFQETTQS